MKKILFGMFAIMVLVSGAFAKCEIFNKKVDEMTDEIYYYTLCPTSNDALVSIIIWVKNVNSKINFYSLNLATKQNIHYFYSGVVNMEHNRFVMIRLDKNKAKTFKALVGTNGDVLEINESINSYVANSTIFIKAFKELQEEIKSAQQVLVRFYNKDDIKETIKIELSKVDFDAYDKLNKKDK